MKNPSLPLRILGMLCIPTTIFLTSPPSEAQRFASRGRCVSTPGFAPSFSPCVTPTVCLPTIIPNQVTIVNNPIYIPVEFPVPAFVFQFVGGKTSDEELEEKVAVILSRHGKGPMPAVLPVITAEAPDSTLPTITNKKVLSTESVAILQVKCAGCHQTPTNKGGVQLFDPTGTFYPKRKDTGATIRDSLIYEVIKSGDMPPGAALDHSKRVPPSVLRELKTMLLESD